MKEFKKLLGNRIYVELPPREESKLVVDENTKESLQREMLQKMSKLRVYEVGDTVSTVKEGDTILIDPGALARALIVPLSKEKEVALISIFDVVHIW